MHFKRQKYPQLGPAAKVTSSAVDVHRSYHTRMPQLGAVAQEAIEHVIKVDGLCTTSLDFVHYRLAMEQLDAEPRRRLKQYGALYINQLLACLATCRAKSCANTLKCNSRMETMRRELADAQAKAWAAGDAAQATFGQAPLQDILAALAVSMANAELEFTRRHFGAMAFTAYEEALYASMCHWLDRGQPGVAWPWGGDETPLPPPAEGTRAELWYYLAGWLLVMTKVWAIKLALRCNGPTRKRQRGSKLSRAAQQASDDRLRQFLDEFVSGASVSPASAKDELLPTAMADGHGHRSWNKHEAQHSSVGMYAFFAFLERTTVLNLENSDFVNRHRGGALLVVKEELLASTAVTTALENVYTGGSSCVDLNSDPRFLAPGSTHGVDPHLTNALLRHLLHYYSRMRGRDYCRALTDRLSTEQKSKQHVGFRGYVATAPQRSKRPPAVESGATPEQEQLHDSLEGMPLEESGQAEEAKDDDADETADDDALAQHCERHDELFAPVVVGQSVHALEDRLLGKPPAHLPATVLSVNPETKTALVHYEHAGTGKSWDQWVPFHEVHAEPPTVPPTGLEPPPAPAPAIYECRVTTRNGSRTFYYDEASKLSSWAVPNGANPVNWPARGPRRPNPPDND